MNDINIAKKIANQPFVNYGKNVLEIGPGMGVLTELLTQKNILLKLVEIDSESVNYLIEKFPQLKDNIFEGDFVKMELKNFLVRKTSRLLETFPTIFQVKLFLKQLKIGI